MGIKQMYPIRSKKTASRILQEEAVIVLPQESKVNTLNPVGTRIWELSDGNRTIKDIIKAIINEFEAEKTEVEKDIIEFINELVNKNMLALQEEPWNEQNG